MVTNKAQSTLSAKYRFQPFLKLFLSFCLAAFFLIDCQDTTQSQKSNQSVNIINQPLIVISGSPSASPSQQSDPMPGSSLMPATSPGNISSSIISSDSVVSTPSYYSYPSAGIRSSTPISTPVINQPTIQPSTPASNVIPTPIPSYTATPFPGYTPIWTPTPTYNPSPTPIPTPTSTPTQTPTPVPTCIQGNPTISYSNNVQPILNNRCKLCHATPDEMYFNYTINNRNETINSGNTKPQVIPCNPNSNLYQKISSPSGTMRPGSYYVPSFTSEEADIIKKWIMEDALNN